MDQLVRLWAEVPQNERVTIEYLLGRFNATNPRWLAKKKRLIESTDGCQVARRVNPNENLWFRCGRPTAPDQQFCNRHGGPSFRTPRPPYVRKTDDRSVLRSRIEKKTERIRELIEQRDRLISELEALD